MSTAIVTGSGGLVGAETARLFLGKGLDVVGVDNDMRGQFFGPDASSCWQMERLRQHRRYTHSNTDIRDNDAIAAIFRRYGHDVVAVVHCAAQPSHHWAARDPFTEFTVNANGTLALLEAARQHAPDAVFILASSNKVYGDRPNHLPVIEKPTRFELSPGHRWAARGLPEDMPIDHCTHGTFGISKAAADLMVQEYGRSFGMRTACFRGGCMAGPGQSGAPLHGFLPYLMHCAVTGRPYTVFGYKGKQVRDTIHVRDVAEAFWAFFERPSPGEIFNIGGGRHANCSVLEAIAMAQELAGREMVINYSPESRPGDLVWWISDVTKFQALYPAWDYRYDLPSLMADVHEGVREHMGSPA